MHALEQLAARALHALHDLLARHGLVHDERGIAFDARELRHVDIVASRAGIALKRSHIELERHHGALGIVGSNRQRVQLAHPANHIAAGKHLGRAARLQMRRIFGGKRLEANLRQRQLASDGLKRALTIEEIKRTRIGVPTLVVHSTRQNAGQLATLPRLAIALVSRKHGANFVQLNIRHAMRLVVRDAAQQAGNYGAAHERLLRIHGVDELNRLAQAVFLHAQLVKIVARGERIGHGLVDAARRKGAMDFRIHELRIRAHANTAATSGKRGGNIVHAIEAQHFFVQVNLTRQVGTERGRNHRQHVFVFGLGHFAAEALERINDEIARDVGAHHGLEALHAELQVRLLAGSGPRVNNATAVFANAGNGAAGNLDDERRSGGRAHLDVMVVDATLVAHGALAEQAQVATRAARAARLEHGSFEQNVGRFLGDLGIKAAHNARERHGALLGRGDNRHVARELAMLAIERGELLAIFGSANHDMGHAIGVLNLVQVKRMQRLAEQEQDVVRHVNDVVHGALANGGKTLDHPVGARANFHAMNHASGVARATHGIGNVDLHGIGLNVARKLQLGGHILQRVRPRLGVHGANLASEAHDGKAVGAVRGNLQVEHRIGEAHEIGDGLADLRIFGKHPNALMVGAHAQFALRAAHAHRGHAAKLRLLDFEIAGKHRANRRDGHFDAGGNVRGAAHDLNRLVAAHIHLHHMHVVGIGVVFTRLDIAHDHAVKRGTKLVNALDARTRKVELVAERLNVRRHLDIIGKPLQRNFHCSSYLKTISQGNGLNQSPQVNQKSASGPLAK